MVLFDTIRLQRTQEEDGWDDRRLDWWEATKDREIKCFGRITRKKYSGPKDGYACEGCANEGFVCMGLTKGLL